MMLCVFFGGLFHSVFLAGYVILSMAGPIHKAPEIDMPTPYTEGSGQGGVLDASAWTDDDTTDDDYSNAGWSVYDIIDGAAEGGGDGGGDEDRNVLIPAGAVEDSTAGLDSLKVTCFHCHGDGMNGCDVATMLHDVQTFSITCFGKCLNLSSGSIAVYDCAYDMVTRLDTCLRNGDTQMCFCTGDFCNGPSENDTIYLRQASSFSHREQSHSRNIPSDDHFNNNNNNNINLNNKSRKHHYDARKEMKTERFGRKYRNKSSLIDRKADVNGNAAEGTSDNEISHTEISTEFSSQEAVHLWRDHQTHMDTLIPSTDSSLADSSTSLDVVIPNAIRIRVGSLKRRGDIAPTSTGTTVVTMSVNVMVFLLLLLMQCSL